MENRDYSVSARGSRSRSISDLDDSHLQPQRDTTLASGGATREGVLLSGTKKYSVDYRDLEKSAEQEWSWVYGKQSLFGLGKGFEISVGIKDGRMIAAGAERYDIGIWWCNDLGCPVVWSKEEFGQLPDPLVAVLVTYDPEAYKPEKVDGAPPAIAAPGEEVNVDGVYSPPGTINPVCVKIPGNCSATAEDNGDLVVRCGVSGEIDRHFTLPLLDDRFMPRALTPEDLRRDNFRNWRDPYTGWNWPFEPWQGH